MCVLETVLAAVVFACTALDLAIETHAHVEADDHGGLVYEASLLILVVALMLTDGACGIVLFTTGCAVRTGLNHSFGRPSSSSPQAAAISSGPLPRGDMDRLERDRLTESLELDGVNLFDFREVVTTSVSVLLGVSSCLLLQLVSVVISLPFSLFFMYSISSSSDNNGARDGEDGDDAESVFVWLVFVAVGLAVFTRLFHKLGVGGKFRNLEQACRTQPSCRRVRGVLVLSSAAYAVVLCLSPVPPVWLWSLVVTHAARALKLFVSLRDQSEAMGAAADDVPRDTL